MCREGCFACADRTNIGECRNAQAIVAVIGAARVVPRSSKMVVKARVVGLQMARGVAKFVHWLYAVIWTANGTEAARQVSLLAMTMVVASMAPQFRGSARARFAELRAGWLGSREGRAAGFLMCPLIQLGLTVPEKLALARTYCWWRWLNP